MEKEAGWMQVNGSRNFCIQRVWRLMVRIAWSGSFAVFFSWALWQCIPTGFGCDGLDCVGDWVGKDSELDYTDSMVVWNDNDIEKNDKVSHFGI